MACVAGRLATESNSKLLSAEIGPFQVIKAMPATVRIDDDSIRNTLSVDRATVAPTTKKTQTEDNRTQTDANREEMGAGNRQMEEKKATSVLEGKPWMA